MTTQGNHLGTGLKTVWNRLTHNVKFNRGATFGMMIIGALMSFEVFNYSTTQYALHDMLGDLTFAGMRWATILAVAFCGIDFAGIARIFTPEQGSDEPAEIYYLFGAWLLAAGFNATLTWWGVAVAVSKNPNLQSSTVMSAETLAKTVPIFIAIMVWLIRLLIIGTFSLAGDRLFSTDPQIQRQPVSNNNTQSRPNNAYQNQNNRPLNQPAYHSTSPSNRQASANNQALRPAPKPVAASQQGSFVPPEPTYHPVSYNSRGADTGDRHFS